MKTLTEEMRESLDMLTEFQPGWVYGEFDKSNEFSDEFIECLKLYVVDAHGQWHGRETAEATRIDKAFQSEMPVMQQSHTVFRGWAPESFDHIADESNFLKNSEITFPWYLSTSTDREEAHYYLENSGSVMLDSPYIVFEIETLAGAKGIVVEDFYRKHRDLNFLERWSGEVILDRNARFKVEYKSNKDSDDDYDDYADWRANGLDLWDVQLRQVA